MSSHSTPTDEQLTAALQEVVDIVTSTEDVRAIREAIRAAGVSPNIHARDLEGCLGDKTKITEWVLGQWASMIDNDHRVGFNDGRNITLTWAEQGKTLPVTVREWEARPPVYLPFEKVEQRDAPSYGDRSFPDTLPMPLAMQSATATQFEDALAVREHAIVDAVLSAFQQTLPHSTWFALDLPSVRDIHVEDVRSNVVFDFSNVGGELHVVGDNALGHAAINGPTYFFAETMSQANRDRAASYANRPGSSISLGSADDFADWLTVTVQALLVPAVEYQSQEPAYRGPIEWYGHGRAEIVPDMPGRAT